MHFLPFHFTDYRKFDQRLRHVVPTPLIDRVRKVLLLNERDGAWYVQQRYETGRSNSWYPADAPMDDRHLIMMVGQRWWLACRAPHDGSTDRVAFDIDCKSGEERAARDAIYQGVRELMGRERVPLVYRTPSMHGLRVVYRIPAMPLGELVTSVSTGLVADACRAAGLPVRPVQLEIFPQRTKVDRLPLGRNMPMLDPETLEPLPHANIGARFDLERLEGAVAEMERWHAHEHADLVPHLRACVRSAEATARTASVAAARPTLVSTTPAAAPTGTALHLATSGLSGPGTRYWAEYQVGLAALEHPALFGLVPPLTDVMVAEAIADWLARRNNGQSREWADSVHRFGAAARRWWVERYLTRDATTGRHMIDRLDAALAARSPEMRRTTMLTPAERDTLMVLAADVLEPDAQRFRAECWLVAWLRAVRTIMTYHERRGDPLVRTVTDGSSTMELEICTRWMRRWPFGEGRNTTRRVPRYVEYRDMLLRAGLMELVCAAPEGARFARQPSNGRDLPQVAHRYRVLRPAYPVRVRDVGVTRAELAAIRSSLPWHYNRRPTIDEIHHVLMLRRWRIDLHARYGVATGDRVSELADAIERGLATRTPAGSGAAPGE